MNLTHRQRMEHCLSGGPLDRPPVALWRHFPVDDQTPDGLAAATVAFQRTYGWDLVKVTPASSFCLKDWGVDDAWEGAPEGTRTYTRRVVHHPEDWLRLRPLDPRAGYLGAQLEALRLITRELGEHTPVVQTIFSPLAQAKNLAGPERLLVHLRRYPDAVEHGLRVITETTLRFIEAARTTGIAGIFYAVQHGTYRLLAEGEYRRFGCPYDLEILQAAGTMWLNILHLHGEDIMWPLFADYPAQVVNWHDRETEPDLATGQCTWRGVVCGGVSRRTLAYGTPEQVAAEARSALEATHGRRVVLSTGCVVPIIAPAGNLWTVRRSVEG